MSSRSDRSRRPLPPAPPPPALNRSRTKNEGKTKSPVRRNSRSRSKSRERYLRTHNTHTHNNHVESRGPPVPPPRQRSRSRSPRFRSRPSREHDSGSRGSRPSATASRSSFSGVVGTPNSAVPSVSSHSSATEASSSRMAVAAQGNSLLLAQEFAIVRAITNPEDVKIPRRLTEGIRPIFDRPDLKEAMRRRMQADDNEVNVYHQALPTPAVEPPSQRVVAIIREPVDYLSLAAAPSAAAGSMSANPQMGNPTRLGLAPGFNPSPPMPSRIRSPPTPDELRARRMSPGDRGPDRIAAERDRERPSRRSRSPDRSRDRMRDVERPVGGSARSKSVGKWVRERTPVRNPSPPGRMLERHRDREQTRGSREVHMSPPMRRDSARAEHHRPDGPPRFTPEPRDRHVFVDHHEAERRPEMIRRSRPRSVSPVLSRHPPPRNDHERDLRSSLSRPPKFQRFDHHDRPHRDSHPSYRGGRGRGRGFGSTRGRRP